MNTDDISFADFLAFHAPPVRKPVDPWLLHAYAFVPARVETALERVARSYERGAGTASGVATTTSLLLGGASVVQQRAAVRWLAERLDLPAVIVDATDLRGLPETALADVLAPLAGEVGRLFVIRNIDALSVDAAARLVLPRARHALLFATASDANACDDALRARFRATIDWQAPGSYGLRVRFAAMLGECFTRFGVR